MTIKNRMNPRFEIEPIREGVSDKNCFATVMPFLDNSKVLLAIQEIRKKLNLLNLIGHESYNEWFDSVTRSLKTAAPTWEAYFKGCIEILEKYGRQDIHYGTLWKAVVCGKITNADCRSAYPEAIYPDLKPCIIPRLAIFFTSNTEEKEVIEAFRERGKVVERYLKYEVGKGFPVGKLIGRNVTLKSLKEQRSCYWMRVGGGLNYKEIADNLGETGEFMASPLEYARNRYRSYKRRVETSIRI